MKKLLTAALVLFAMLFLLSPMAFAASAEEAFDKCQNQADAEEVTDANLKAWITTCMNDEGISADDAKRVIDQEFSSDDQESAQSSSQE